MTETAQPAIHTTHTAEKPPPLTEVQQKFQKAVHDLRSFTIEPIESTLNNLFGLYKQALFGDCQECTYDTNLFNGGINTS